MSTRPPTPERAAFGRRVRELREGRGWSQEQFAQRAGLHRTYISSVEHGVRNVAFDNIIAIAQALGSRPCDLFEDTPP